ncbi:hypothetical protein SISSUDRAFT_1047728 [Sistotremastrum suecicum HHB10207 ss-3]|uniref:DUF7330 domain-containing protein n=1 Tax=Sistotremastrum suecicum HHB10207 ss-3 TaxID=1314776 RepID=A0A166CZX4_9AGAM|nr:hypothetical protein SISSUDRAFT_1047728 [Sistotremastrum suecicum HHB10207 ss-3]
MTVRTNFLDICLSEDVTGKWLVDTCLPYSTGLDTMSRPGLELEPNLGIRSKRGCIDINIEIVNDYSSLPAVIFCKAKTRSTVRLYNLNGAQFSLVSTCGGYQYVYIPRSFKGFIETFPPSPGRLVFSAEVGKNIIPLISEAAKISDTSVHFHRESDKCSCSCWNLLESAVSSLIFQVQEGTLVRIAYHDETSSPKPSQSRIFLMDEYTADNK